MSDNIRGCFAWLVRLKKSCNERWAKCRNRIRKRLYKEKGEVLEADTLKNETGTMDIVITKIPTGTLSPRSVQSFDEDLEIDGYVNGIILKAKAALEAENRNIRVINVQPTEDDGASLSSSIISQIADFTVTDSLTNIVQDVNQSAVPTAGRPKTASELIDSLGIHSAVTDNYLPAVSD